MNSFKFTINGNEYHVEVKGLVENVAHLEVNGTLYEVELDRKVKSSKTPKLVRPVNVGPPKPEIDKQDAGTSQPVTAPLPGNILEIFVNPGDIIKKGQKLLIMEAMKMENQVLAEKDGVVEKIHVAKGQSVLQGDVLFDII